MRTPPRIILPAACLLMALACPRAEDRPPQADVRAYGAIGDGTTDDTAAIRRAIDAGQGIVRFPKGSYRITSTLPIELDRTGITALVGDRVARVVMAGPGPAFRFVGTHEGTAAPKSVTPEVWERQRMPTADGIEITGDHPEADGIEAEGTMQLTVTHCLIRRVRNGIRLAGRNRNVLIANCHIYENTGPGILYDNVNLHQSNVSACHISYCSGGGIVSRAGNVRNLHIGTCDIESNMSADTPATANILLDSTGGSIGEVAITGCTIQHNSTSPDSANIRILGEGHAPDLLKRTGSDATSEGHVTISGNVLSDVRTNIHIRHARGVTITGNTFWMGYDRDILVEDCRQIIIGPNNLDRNPRYAYGTTSEANGGVLLRNTRDSSLHGLHLNGIWRQPAAILLDRCDRIHLSACTVLDSDNAGIALEDSTRCRIADCFVRDDREGDKPGPSLRIRGGSGNTVAQNTLGHSPEIDPTAIARQAK